MRQTTSLTPQPTLPQPFGDQRPRLIDPIERDERAKTRPLALAEQHFVDRLEPVAQVVREPVRLADFVDDRLQVFRARAARPAISAPHPAPQRLALLRVGARNTLFGFTNRSK